MSDLISRQAVIDAFFSQSDDDGWWVGTAQDAETLLNGLPSAEPVVRCKDCKTQQTCNFAQYQGNNGFCSLAERKEGVEE